MIFFKSIKCHIFSETQARPDCNDGDDDNDDDVVDDNNNINKDNKEEDDDNFSNFNRKSSIEI